MGGHKKNLSTNFHTLPWINGYQLLQLQSTLLIKYCSSGKDHSPSFRYTRPLFLRRSVPLRGSKLCSSDPYGTIHSSERFTGYNILTLVLFLYLKIGIEFNIGTFLVVGKNKLMQFVQLDLCQPIMMYFLLIWKQSKI